MKFSDRTRPFAALLALCAALCIVLCLLASCGRAEPGKDAPQKEDSDAPAEGSGSAANSDRTSTNVPSDTPDDPYADEDYPPLEMVYSYDGAESAQLVFLNNSGEALSYQVIVEWKTDAGWEVPDGGDDPLSGMILANGSACDALSFDARALSEHPDIRIVCRYEGEGWKAPREQAIELHYGDAQTSDARRVFGGAADPAWSVDAKGRCLLNFAIEEKGAAFVDGTDSGNFCYVLSYADIAKIGDKAGAYSFYDRVTPIGFGERTEDGANFSLVTALGGKEALHPGTQYDLCLTVFCVTENGGQIEALYLTTRVDYTEQDAEIVKDSLNFTDVQQDDPIRPAKPVLYLYPEKETDVTVRLTVDGEMTASWPPYGEGWTVTASPDGMLTDAAGNEYPYLFYELSQTIALDFSQGFCVPGEKTGEFLRAVLSKMGLTPKEYTDFIVYWLPRMQENAYNVITFCGEEYTESAALEITPSPDSLLRVCMVYYGSDTPVDIASQTFPPFLREGFTAVEWGGAELTR